VHIRGTILVAVALLLVGCTAGTTVQFQPEFLPVKFSINSQGHISVGMSSTLVTELGTISISADLSHDLLPKSGGLRVAIADRPADGAHQEVYEVGFHGTVGFCTDGRALVSVTQDLVEVRPTDDTTAIWMVDTPATAAVCNQASSGTAPAATEYVTNGGFESELAGWENCHGVSTANMKTSDHDNPHSGARKLTHYSDRAYEQLTCQILSVPNGHYTFSGWARSKGGQYDLWFYAKGYSHSSTEVQARIGSAPVSTWTKYSIDDITVTDGTIEVGVWSRAPANTWAVFDDISLTSN
jgi:hypothetical protein